MKFPRLKTLSFRPSTFLDYFLLGDSQGRPMVLPDGNGSVRLPVDDSEIRHEKEGFLDRIHPPHNHSGAPESLFPLRGDAVWVHRHLAPRCSRWAPTGM